MTTRAQYTNNLRGVWLALLLSILFYAAIILGFIPTGGHSPEAQSGNDIFVAILGFFP